MFAFAFIYRPTRVRSYSTRSTCDATREPSSFGSALNSLTIWRGTRGLIESGEKAQLRWTGQITFRSGATQDHSLRGTIRSRKGAAHPAKHARDYASGLARHLARQVRPVLIATESPGDLKTSQFGRPVLQFCTKKNDGQVARGGGGL